MGHAKDIWGHSSELGTRHYTIFAINDPIQEAAFKGWALNEYIGYKPLVGAYKGQAEHSFIVNSDNLGRIAQAGWLRGQESVLSLGTMDSQDRRAAKLIYLDPNGWPADSGDGPDGAYEKDLGVFKSVSREEALNNWEQGWTYDPSTKEYYITVDPNAVKLDEDAISKCEAELQQYCDCCDVREIVTTYLKNARSI